MSAALSVATKSGRVGAWLGVRARARARARAGGRGRVRVRVRLARQGGHGAADARDGQRRLGQRAPPVRVRGRARARGRGRDAKV